MEEKVWRKAILVLVTVLLTHSTEKSRAPFFHKTLVNKSCVVGEELWSLGFVSRVDSLSDLTLTSVCTAWSPWGSFFGAKSASKDYRLLHPETLHDATSSHFLLTKQACHATSRSDVSFYSSCDKI